MLSLPRPRGVDSATEHDVVVFSVCGERFAVDAGYVLEAFELGEPTPVPGTPERLVGVVNHRGRVLRRDGPARHARAGRRAGRRADPRRWPSSSKALAFGIAAEAVEETSRERAGGGARC